MPGDRLQRILAELSLGGSSWTASRLCAVIPELAGVNGAGVMLMSGDLPRGSLCVTDDVSQLIEDLQYTLGEGPCVDAYQQDTVVAEPNLADPPGRRWFALPLRLRDATIGAMNMLNDTRAPIGEPDLIVARGFADLAAVSILQHRVSEQAQRVNEQLSSALTSRVVIEQAKGVISERAGIGLAEAFGRLRNYARFNGLRLTDVARAAVDGTLDPRAWGPPSWP